MIVESPSKAKTIQSYLGSDYKVIATVGHIIDLPTSKLGVDIDHNYDIDYTVIKGKDKVISDIKKAVKDTTGTVYLSPDPDREGESIAWQVAKICNLSTGKYKRVVFHEVTKSAIQEAIENPREIDEDLVEAQQGRRVLDRLVGYPLSQLLWKKIKYGLSAGRVQSVALRLIAERENEILSFIPTPYHTYEVTYKETGKDLVFRLTDKEGTLFKASSEFAKEFGSLVTSDTEHVVVGYVEKEVYQSPSAPFTTSLLQQTANKKFGFTAKQTMQIAQQLYQGIEIGKEGLQGLITYMRTDAAYMSETAVATIRSFIKKEYGDAFLNPEVRRYKTKAKVAQEAHEAIRPTHVEMTPESVADHLTSQQLKLYRLIWNRAVETQMTQAKVLEMTLTTTSTNPKVASVLEDNKVAYTITAQRTLFKGYRMLEKDKASDGAVEIPPLQKGQTLSVTGSLQQDLMTIPRSRYNDASLVKEMEKRGIGRPSTYASIIGTLVARGYVTRENKLLTPSDIGMLVAKFLIQNFEQIVDYNFTAEMEDKLDQIVNEHLSKKKMLDDFYPAFMKDLQAKEKTIQKAELTDLGEAPNPCPKCGSKMRIKLGPWGKYYHCTNEECKHSEPFIDNEKYFTPDEVKTEGYVLKKGRFGLFWAHPDYPAVKKTLPVMLKEVCPLCGKHLVERSSKTGRKFVGCSGYPDCKYIANATFNRNFSKSPKKTLKQKTTKAAAKATTKKRVTKSKTTKPKKAATSKAPARKTANAKKAPAKTSRKK